MENGSVHPGAWRYTTLPGAPSIADTRLSRLQTKAGLERFLLGATLGCVSVARAAAAVDNGGRPADMGATGAEDTISRAWASWRPASQPVIPSECFGLSKTNTVERGMRRIQNIIALPWYDSGRNAENCALEVARPLATEIPGFNRMRICPPVVREVGFRQRDYAEVVWNVNGNGDVVIRQFIGSICEDLQSGKGSARCGVNHADSFMVPASRVSSGIAGRKPTATDSPTGQVLPGTVFDCAQHILNFGHTLGVGDERKRRPTTQGGHLGFQPPHCFLAGTKHFGRPA